MSDIPEEKGQNPEKKTAYPGKDSKGWFVKGNQGGPGSRAGHRCAAYQFALDHDLNAEQLQVVVQTIIEQALGGDVHAASVLLRYALGKPGKAVDPDTIDAQEYALLKADLVEPSELALFESSLPVGPAILLAGCATLAVEKQSKENLQAAISDPPAPATPAPVDTPEEPEKGEKASPAPRKRKQEKQEPKVVQPSYEQWLASFQKGLECPSEEGISAPASEGGSTVTPRRLTDDIPDNERHSATSHPDNSESFTRKKNKPPGSPSHE